MRARLLLILLSALMTPGLLRGQDRPLYVSPLLSYDNFHTPGFDFGMDFGAGAGLRVSPSISVSAAVLFGPRTLTFDAVAGSQSFTARIFSIEGSVEFLILGRPGSGVSASFGAGRISGTIDAQSVSLGALGSVTIPERSVARGFLEPGLTGEIPLSQAVGVVIHPSARFFSPLSSPVDFSFAGGLRVGIL
jgi:hypothetical protein